MDAGNGTVTDRSSSRLSTPRRGFRVLDAMMLVAATALGCGWMSAICGDDDGFYDLWRGVVCDWPSYDILTTVGEKSLELALVTIPFIAMGTLALIPIRFVGSRPRFHRLACQPGLIAAGASGVAILVMGLPTLVAGLTAGANSNLVLRMPVTFTVSVAMAGGLAVLVSWMTLLVTGRWRAEPSWIDRLGRSMGFFWIAIGFGVCAGGQLPYEPSVHFIPRSPPEAVGETILRLASLMMPYVALAMLAIMPVRWLAVRRRSRRSARPAGLMAMDAVCLAILFIELPISALALFLFMNARSTDAARWFFNQEPEALATFCGLAVSVSWLTLLGARRWRTESSWIDRLGRSVGGFWLAAGLAVMAGIVLVVST